ncbi:MAG: hypothetical protein A2583_02955 [Bdellovibrionales bacterium RIFOXYD1_FULL_53_11]|nr:MAG: hypothetical protein A2583_02955 [Bdellovibrionales bacterium RIFOXYD1_FULL_53_11]
MGEATKRDPVAIVVDERVPREKLKLLQRVINEIRSFSMVLAIEGGISEDELLAKLGEQHYKLVLLPWYRYLAWNKIDAFFGTTRTAGTAVAGYFADQVLPYELGDKPDIIRSILLDFTNLITPEASMLTKCLLRENQRTGIRPLFAENTPVYFENWLGAQGLGGRIDAVLGLPEVVSNGWLKRSQALRIALGSLWSLVYEEGPGKSQFALAQSEAAKVPKAYFQVAADAKCLALRLCYNMSSFLPKDALAMFWPDQKRPTAQTQSLLKYADAVRVHNITDTFDVEVTAFFFQSAPSETSHQQMHSLWLEPLTSHLMTEIPYEAQSPDTPHLRPLPVQQIQTATKVLDDKAQLKAKERFIFQAAVKIRELKKSLVEREEQVKELRSGGIGTAQPLPPPDAEGLLDAFQERVLDSQYRIRKLEQEIATVEQTGDYTGLDSIRQKVSTLMSREQSWIRKIGEILEICRAAKKKQAG